jgi:hypothetical protein
MLVGATLTITGCESSSDSNSDSEVVDLTNVDEAGNTTIDPDALQTELDSLSTGTLTENEASGLRFMREEEKLARDVYLALFDLWQLSIFRNISDSEQTHMDAVKTLLDRYELTDPSAGKQEGEFTDASLQNLYNQLTATGAQSLSSALQVGAAIEEIDIIDLQEYIAQTDTDDIIIVYENLTKGSRNHLRSFVSALQNQTGETYTPQYLSQTEYDEIVNAPMEQGRNR